MRTGCTNMSEVVESSLPFLGSWSTNDTELQSLHQQFMHALPYPHVVIPNFFAPEVAARIESRFPIPHGQNTGEWLAQGWHVSHFQKKACMYGRDSCFLAGLR